MARILKRTRRTLRRLPPALRVILALVVIAATWAAMNWSYQVVRKPAELFFPVSGTLMKTAPETWREYAPLFRAHSTETITPELLAALAQVETDGNPVARTYWRWRFAWNPFKWYQPASSAVGMYQITDGTFAEAKHYCVHNHVVVEATRWSDVHGCWFNGLYTRVVPSHAIEMTSALLDHEVADVLARHRIVRATPAAKRNLAAVIHLCGSGGGDAFVHHGFRAAGIRCGDHSAADYLNEVVTLERTFAAMADAEAAKSKAETAPSAAPSRG